MTITSHDELDGLRAIGRIVRQHRTMQAKARAMEIGIRQVGQGKPLVGIGQAIGRFFEARGYKLIGSLGSDGVGCAPHEAPTEVAPQPTRGDDWTIYSSPNAALVQYEHTVVATDRAAIIVTRPG